MTDQLQRTSWLWPNHTIGVKESRQLREEHNALVNSHAELLDALAYAEAAFVMLSRGLVDESEPFALKNFYSVRAAIAKAQPIT